MAEGEVTVKAALLAEWLEKKAPEVWWFLDGEREISTSQHLPALGQGLHEYVRRNVERKGRHRVVVDPRYPLSLLLRVITVSLETMKIVSALPALDILDEPAARENGKVVPFRKIPDNVWMGVSVESAEYTPRVDDLRSVKTKVRFLSVEPLLGPIVTLNLRGIHWVIVGGESGPRARGMDADWVRAIRDRCVGAEVPFFFKQWGGVRKHTTGRILDGRTWDEMPDHTAGPNRLTRGR